MSLRIIKAGFQTTVQDLGRWGFQSIGVPVGGAMDEDALTHANLLTGNNLNDACLEIGPGEIEIEFELDTLIACSGNGHKAFVNKNEISFDKAVMIKNGVRLVLKPNSSGMWSYISVGGGLDVDEVLSSRSTYLPAKFGGFEGRVLQSGDVISINGEKSQLTQAIETSLFLDGEIVNIAKWSIPKKSNEGQTSIIRVIRGLEWNCLSNSFHKTFYNQPFSVSADSNRMGYRLNAENKIRKTNKEMISTAVTKGTVQLTNDGNLIILMADGQTVGGYPRIGQIASVDISKLVQKRPGDSFQFKQISFVEAEQLFLFREQQRSKYKQAIKLRF